MTKSLHLKQTLFLGLDALKKRWVRELELVILCGLKRVVRLGFGHLLDEFFKITTVSAELEAVQMEDIGDCVVEEAGVVRDDDYSKLTIVCCVQQKDSLEVQVLRLVR